MPTKSIKQKLQERYAKWTIYILIVFGILGVTGRLIFSEHLKLPEGDAVWTVSIEAQITNAEKGERFSLSPPWNTSQARIVSQTLQHTGMRQVRIKSDDVYKRWLVLQVTDPGDLTLYAEFNIHTSTIPKIHFVPAIQPLDPDKRSLYLSSEEKIDLTSLFITDLMKKISTHAKNNDELIKLIFNYTKNNLVKVDSGKNNDVAEIVLQTNKASTLGRVRAMVGLCRIADIPARIVSGFILEESLEAIPHYWLEVYNDTNWIPYDPEKGHAETLPGNFIAFSRGNSHILNPHNIDKFNVTYNIEQNYDLKGLNISTEKQLRDIFDLNRFPPDTRSNLSLLILLPLGALLTAFCRNFLGIRGYGTFTPTLLALAAVYADWIAALVLLIIVIALGLSGRSTMPDKLSRTPRLAIMFTIVVMSMLLGVSLMEYFKITPGGHVLLLPIVILTSLIDRFYSTADNDGIHIAIRRLAWTIVISILCYPIIKLESLGAFLLTYPETHFITLSLILMISTYKGKQLSEHSYFRWIREPSRSKKTSNETLTS